MERRPRVQVQQPVSPRPLTKAELQAKRMADWNKLSVFEKVRLGTKNKYAWAVLGIIGAFLGIRKVVYPAYQTYKQDEAEAFASLLWEKEKHKYKVE